MSRFSCLFLVAIVGLASACTSVHKSADYMNTPEYRNRTKLTGALAVGDNGLTEESINDPSAIGEFFERNAYLVE